MGLIWLLITSAFSPSQQLLAFSKNEGDYVPEILAPEIQWLLFHFNEVANPAHTLKIISLPHAACSITYTEL